MIKAISESRIKNATVLVVDDVAINRKILSHSLMSKGFNNIICANNGEEALKITREYKPDLVILDLMMPVMDGFTYCREIRNDKDYDTMPIIVQTALDDIGKKLEIFQLGASDYVNKPVNPTELVARTEIHLSQKLMMKDLRDYHHRTSMELKSARGMQNRLMPGEKQLHLCERVYNLKMGKYFLTSSQIGGDCWGIQPLSDYRLAIWMYDFSGHGITAAMNVFRTHTIMQEFMTSTNEPGSFLSILSKHLYSLLEPDEFATMFYGIIDTEANCLLYASAAAPPATLITHKEKEILTLQSRAFPLGIMPDATYETKYQPFCANDLLLLYSDCLIESMNESGKCITEDEVNAMSQKILNNHNGNPASEIADALAKYLHEHHTDPLTDDITINTYWRRPD